MTGKLFGEIFGGEFFGVLRMWGVLNGRLIGDFGCFGFYLFMGSVNWLRKVGMRFGTPMNKCGGVKNTKS